MSAVTEKAVATMQSLLSETKRMQEGYTPNPMLVASLQAELVELIWQVSMEQNTKFSAKEQAGFQRKKAQGLHQLSGRERGLSIEDSKNEALQEAEQEFRQEIQAIREWEDYRTLTDSMKRAFEHSRSILSLLKTSENL